MKSADLRSATTIDARERRVLLPADLPLQYASTPSKIAAAREWVRAVAVLGAITTDIALVGAAAITASYLRFGGFPTLRTSALVLTILPAYILAACTFQAYNLDVLRSHSRSVARAWWALLIAASLAFTAAFALQVGSRFSRLETGIMLAAAGVYLTIGRVFGVIWLQRIHDAIDPIVCVLGDRSTKSRGDRAQRTINVREMRWSPTSSDPDFLDTVHKTFKYADRVILSFSDPGERRDWAAFMRQTGLNAELVEPALATIVPLGIGKWDDAPTLIVSRGPLSLHERAAKRALDLIVTISLAPFVIPLAIVVAMLVKLESPGPCFFVQERVGRRNSRYPCYKFRTMRVEASDPSGKVSTSRQDDRITPLGSVLRRTSLDELPQLWNVLRGDMSLVGPRPHALGSTAGGVLFWDAVSSYWTRHAVRPGLTGLAQIRGLRGATASQADIRQRVAADLEYINTWSFWLDLKILISTLRVFVHRNAF